MLSTIKNLLQLSIRDKWLFYKTISIGKLKMKKTFTITLDLERIDLKFHKQVFSSNLLSP